MIKSEMKKMQYGIDKVVEKIFALLSGEIRKY